ncbi:UNVERIFIED_CONTAM: hypothetical protein GTU68_028872 [Idotea baltica]|nr:hypothetical protein [Idotea baltica]
MKLHVENLTKSFGDRVVVDDLSFEIEPGQTFGLLGPNGAGKTTAISMICGLLKPDAGIVRLDERAVSVDAVGIRRHIGYVPQAIAVYPDLSAAENLEFFGRLQGLKGTTLANRVSVVLDVLGLSDRRGDRAETFSGGMQRRLNIGLGLLHEPDLLVLDEPTVGVDPQSRNSILDAVEELSARGLALLYTTHYMEEAERLCDQLVIMDEGATIAAGTKRELVSQIGEDDVIRVECSNVPPLDPIADLAGVREAAFDGRRGELRVDNAAQRLPEVLAQLAAAGAEVRSVDIVEPDLESVFLAFTGKALRDR